MKAKDLLQNLQDKPQSPLKESLKKNRHDLDETQYEDDEISERPSSVNEDEPKRLSSMNEDEPKRLSSMNEDKVNEAYENISKRLEALRRESEETDETEEDQPKRKSSEKEKIQPEDDPLDNDDEIDSAENDEDLLDDEELEEPVKEPDDLSSDDEKERHTEEEPRRYFRGGKHEESNISNLQSEVPIARNFDDSEEFVSSETFRNPQYERHMPQRRESSYSDRRDSPLDDEDLENTSSKRFQSREAMHNNENSLDDLAKEEGSIRNEPEEDNTSQMHIPNLHSPKPAMNLNYQYRSESFEKKSSKLNIFILGFVALAVIGGTVYLLKNQSKEAKTPEPSPTMTTITTPAPSPTPTPAPLDRAKFKIRILNGTLKTGMAATVAGKLKDLGYQTEKVGNATNSAFVKTVVRVKPSATGLADQLISDLVSSFDASISIPLKDSDTVDGEVILGTK